MTKKERKIKNQNNDMKVNLCFQLSGFFSNPFDVIKTRQQLQGEMVAIKHGVKDLQLKAEKRKQPYKNIFQSIKSILEAEGTIANVVKFLP